MPSSQPLPRALAGVRRGEAALDQRAARGELDLLVDGQVLGRVVGVCDDDLAARPPRRRRPRPRTSRRGPGARWRAPCRARPRRAARRAVSGSSAPASSTPAPARADALLAQLGLSAPRPAASRRLGARDVLALGAESTVGIQTMRAPSRAAISTATGLMPPTARLSAIAPSAAPPARPRARPRRARRSRRSATSGRSRRGRAPGSGARAPGRRSGAPPRRARRARAGRTRRARARAPREGGGATARRSSRDLGGRERAQPRLGGAGDPRLDRQLLEQRDGRLHLVRAAAGVDAAALDQAGEQRAVGGGERALEVGVEPVAAAEPLGGLERLADRRREALREDAAGELARGRGADLGADRSSPACRARRGRPRSARPRARRRAPACGCRAPARARSSATSANAAPEALDRARRRLLERGRGRVEVGEDGVRGERAGHGLRHLDRDRGRVHAQHHVGSAHGVGLVARGVARPPGAARATGSNARTAAPAAARSAAIADPASPRPITAIGHAHSVPPALHHRSTSSTYSRWSFIARSARAGSPFSTAASRASVLLGIAS